MASTHNPVSIRIAWCRRQRARAGSESEVEGWRAEEEGLRDAVLRQDHANQYRLCSPKVFERYAMGLQDGAALMALNQSIRHRSPTR